MDQQGCISNQYQRHCLFSPFVLLHCVHIFHHPPAPRNTSNPRELSTFIKGEETFIKIKLKNPPHTFLAFVMAEKKLEILIQLSLSHMHA